MQRLQYLFFALFLVLCAEGAQRCYSGSKDHYESRLCDTGVAGNYVCQKFVCEGGRSPFVLRTCANKNMNCLAGPAICNFMSENFTIRSCIENGNQCTSSAQICGAQQGTGRCSLCDDDNCNATGGLSVALVIAASLLLN